MPISGTILPLHVFRMVLTRIALGVTRRTFEELLPRFGFSALADDQATIDAELHA